VTQQNRGIAYAAGVLYRGFTDGHVIAINATTGATLWNQKVTASGSVERIVAAPLAWNGNVYIGTSNSDTAQVCHMLALNASSGATVWSKQTVPNVGDSAAATWQGAAHIVGGSMWTSFTIDPTHGIVYVPIGNPEPDFDVRLRQGTNLYTNSVLALDAGTGSLKAGIQLVPADAHDWDQGATPALVTLANGKQTLLSAGKDGFLRSVATNTFVQNWRTPVTTITNAAAPIAIAGTHFCPLGAVLWNGPAYSPANGLAFVNAMDRCTTVALAPSPQPYVAGHDWTGTTNGFGTPDSAKSGWLSAVNATSGSVVWRYHSALPLVAGVTPTSGNLLFTADLAGNLLAFNATSGALLSAVPTGLPVGGGVLTYEVSGKQYVAVAAGMSSASYGATSASSAIVVLGT
jgi:glucose dehydrogenase